MNTTTFPIVDAAVIVDTLLSSFEDVTKSDEFPGLLRVCNLQMEKVSDDLIRRTFFHHPGEVEMARKHNTRFAEWEWADIFMSVADFSAFDEWYSSQGKQVGSHASELLETGHRLSLQYIPDEGEWRCTMSGTTHSGMNENMGLSSSSTTLQEAISITYYKHFVINNGGQWPVNQSKRRR